MPDANPVLPVVLVALALPLVSCTSDAPRNSPPQAIAARSRAETSEQITSESTDPATLHSSISAFTACSLLSSLYSDSIIEKEKPHEMWVREVRRRFVRGRFVVTIVEQKDAKFGPTTRRTVVRVRERSAGCEIQVRCYGPVGFILRDRACEAEHIEKIRSALAPTPSKAPAPK